MDIDQVIRRAKAGDIESFKFLFERHKDMIFNYVIRLGISPEDAEEICDDVFLHVYRNFAVFRCDAAEQR